MADRPGVRRLHPRLRVFKNGDRFVNALRSDAAATMACGLPALDKTHGVPRGAGARGVGAGRGGLGGLVAVVRHENSPSGRSSRTSPRPTIHSSTCSSNCIPERSDVPQTAGGGATES